MAGEHEGACALMPKKKGLRMCAANGTEITNYGRKIMKFKGLVAKQGEKCDMGESEVERKRYELWDEPGEWYQKESGFARQM